MGVVEVTAIVGFVAASGVVLPDMARAVQQHGVHALWLLLLLPLAHVAADLFTGFMHFFADNFCSDRTPVLGPAFVRRFREHHVDPTAICRLSFRELNGGLVLVAVPIYAPIALWADESASLLALGVSLFVWVFLLFATSTNQVHRWAHDLNPPRWARWLAARGLILDPVHHARHHVAPHDRHFCITHGWLNPYLDQLGVWHALARGLAALGVPQSPLSVMGRLRAPGRAGEHAAG